MGEAHYDCDVPVLLKKDVEIVAISCGDCHSAFVTGDNKMFVFGHNGYKQCVNSDQECIFEPTECSMDGILETAMVQCAYNSTLVYTNETGTVYSKGCNKYGTLGIGKGNKMEATWQKVMIDDKIISMNSSSFVFAMSTYNIYVWGQNDTCQLLDSTKSIIWTPVKLEVVQNMTKLPLYDNNSYEAKLGCLFYIWLNTLKQNVAEYEKLPLTSHVRAPFTKDLTALHPALKQYLLVGTLSKELTELFTGYAKEVNLELASTEKQSHLLLSEQWYQRSFVDSSTATLQVYIQDTLVHKVHPEIICLHSPVFKALVTGSFSDSSCTRIDLDLTGIETMSTSAQEHHDTLVTAMRSLLSYMYCGRIRHGHNWIELFVLHQLWKLYNIAEPDNITIEANKAFESAEHWEIATAEQKQYLMALFKQTNFLNTTITKMLQ